MEGHKHDASRGDERPLGFGPGSWQRSFTLITSALPTIRPEPARFVARSCPELRRRSVTWGRQSFYGPLTCANTEPNMPR